MGLAISMPPRQLTDGFPHFLQCQFRTQGGFASHQYQKVKRINMAGRNPKPTALKLIQGTLRADRANPAEFIPQGDLRAAPGWMNESEKAGWDFAISKAPKGLLKELDQSVLTIWVVAENLHREATEKVHSEGMITLAPNTKLPIQSPYMPIINRQAEIMLKAAGQMGFTPASRSKIVMTEEINAENPWAKFT
jgi:P27 family predicted phage terminase small subunit